MMTWPILNLLWDIKDISTANTDKVQYYHDLYFKTKKRRDISRKAKSRIMKNAEKEWNFWQSIGNHFDNMYKF